MALSPAEAQRLADLRAAYDQLIAGKAVAKVQRDGRSIDFAQADVARLRAEIESLEAAAAGRRRGPIRFRFR